MSPRDPHLVATAILDYEHAEVAALLAGLGPPSPSPRAQLQALHRRLTDIMAAVYSIDEMLPVSRILCLRRGSCSQRLACLEALARACGIPTRVRALWLDRSFWFFRLPLLRPVLPKRTLLPWPQFRVDGEWQDFDELYDSVPRLARMATHPFTNRGESLFDAVRKVPIDFLGKSERSGIAAFSLARFVVEDGGFYDTRDELIRALDHTTWLGRLIFKLTYDGHPVRRAPE
jgi:transglutaminase superfamily protein